MPLNLKAKKTIVKEVNQVASQAVAAIVAHYRGLTVAQMTDLRVQAKKQGTYLRVVPNRLTRRALENTPFSCLEAALCGPVILAFSPEDPGLVARLLRQFAKENPAFVVKALAVGSQYLEASALESIATLPTREEALALLLSAMKAPITQWVQLLREPYARLTRVLNTIGEQKRSQPAAT